MKNRRIIFETCSVLDDAAYEAWKEDTNALDPKCDESWEAYNEYVWSCLDDERANLDKPIDGVVVGFATLGLWNGRPQASKVYGENANSFLKDADGYDYPEFFSDGYNVRAILPHHDGTNTVLYRVARDRKHAEDLAYKIAFEGMTEKQFRRATRSLHPVVAEVYGWPTGRKRKVG